MERCKKQKNKNLLVEYTGVLISP